MILLLQILLTGVSSHIATAFVISGLPEYISDFTNQSISEKQSQPYKIHTTRLISASHIFTTFVCPKNANITEIEFIPAIDADHIVFQFWRQTDSNIVQLMHNVTLNSESGRRDENGAIHSLLSEQITCTENWMLGIWIDENVYPISLISNLIEEIPDSTYLAYTRTLYTRLQPSINQQYTLNTQPQVYRSYSSGHFLAVKIHFHHNGYVPPATPPILTTPTTTTPTTTTTTTTMTNPITKQQPTTIKSTTLPLIITARLSTARQKQTTAEHTVPTSITQIKTIFPITSDKVQITPNTTSVPVKSGLKLTLDGWILPVIIAVSSAFVLAILLIIIILCVIRHNRHREAKIARFKAENGLPIKASSDISVTSNDDSDPTTQSEDNDSPPPGYNTGVYTQVLIKRMNDRMNGNINGSLQFSENDPEVNFGTFKKSPKTDDSASTLKLTDNPIYMTNTDVNVDYSDLPPPATSLYEDDLETCVTKC